MRIVDLTHLIEEDMSVFIGVDSPTLRRILKTDGSRETRLNLNSHAGTHIDPAAHMFPGSAPLETLDLARFIGIATILDCSDAPSQRIEFDQLKKYEQRIKKAEFVIIKTGWESHWKHHFDKHITDDEYWQMMQLNINSGKVLYAGTCSSTGWSLAKQQMAARQRNIFGFISEQTNYSLLNRFVELEVLPAAKHFGVGVLSFMSLAGGILTCKSMNAAGARTKFVIKEYEYNPENSAQLQAFSKLCAELGEKESVVASAWTIHNPVVSTTLLGARVARHLNDVPRIVELKLPEDFMRKLDEIFTYSNGRPLRPNTEAPFAYSGLGSKEEYFIEFYRQGERG